MFLGIAVTFLLANKTAKKYGHYYYDLFIVGGFALLIGLPCGSLLYAIVTYSFQEIISFISQGNFRAFGGIVFYGAFIGGLIGGLLGTRVAKMDIMTGEKIIVPYIPIGHAIGRIGCVMAGCCHGMPYDGPFAIYYKNSIAGVSPEQGFFPVQILEALLNTCICFILVMLRKKTTKKFELFSAYFMLYGVARFFLEFFRGDAIRGIYFSISTSQWISLGLFAIGLSYMIYSKVTKDAKQSAEA